MPIVPHTERTPARIRNLPQIQGFLASPEDFGGGLADALGDFGSQGMRAVEQQRRIRERKDREEADKALTAYLSAMDATINGSTDAAGNITPGLKEQRLAAAKGVAARYTAAEIQWFESPDKPFAKLSPRQRQLFEENVANYSQRFRSAMVDHELNETRAQRDVDRTAAFKSHDSAFIHSIGTENQDALLAEAAARYADTQVKDQVDIVGGVRSFASPAAEALHKSAAAEYHEKGRLQIAGHYVDRATDATDDETAKALYKQAEEQTALMTPTSADRIRSEIDRSRKTRDTAAKAAAYEAERQAAKARDQELDRLDKLEQDWMTSDNPDTDSYIREMAKSPETASANQRIAAALRHQSALAAEARKSQEQLAKQQAEAWQRTKIVALGAGFAIGKDGRPVSLSPQEIIAAANADFVSNDPDSITEAQRKDIIASAKSLEDSRVAAFHRRAVNELLPDLAAAVVRDEETGEFTVSQKKRANGDPVYSPTAKTPYTDTYQDPRGNKQSSRRVLLQQAVEAMNTMRQRLALDPKMDPDKAVDLLRAELTGTLAESDRLTIEDSLRAQAERNADLRAAFRVKSVTPVKPTSPQN